MGGGEGAGANEGPQRTEKLVSKRLYVSRRLVRGRLLSVKELGISVKLGRRKTMGAELPMRACGVARVLTEGEHLPRRPQGRWTSTHASC